MDIDIERRFNKLDKGQHEIKEALGGDITKNTPGLCERVRNLEKTHKRVIKMVGFVFAAVFIQIAAWIKSIITGS